MPFKALARAIARLQQLWLAHRIDQVRTHMRRELALHQQHMAQLRAELDALELRQVRSYIGQPLGNRRAVP
jgi:hypothetical protein